MTVKDIVMEYLQEHGYDGLCFPDIECGCGLEDFAPCSEMCESCEAAHHHPPTPECPDGYWSVSNN